MARDEALLPSRSLFTAVRWVYFCFLATCTRRFSCPFIFVCQLLNLMSGEVKRDLKEDNPKDDALTNTYNALKVCVFRRKVKGAHQVSSLVAAHRKSTGVVVVVGERTRHFRVQ